MALVSAALTGLSLGKKAYKVAKKLRRRGRSSAVATALSSGPFTGRVGDTTFEAPPDDYVTIDEETMSSSNGSTTVKVKLDEEGHPIDVVEDGRRRRRRRLLTTQDKSDIAFIIGTMGKSEMAKATIAQLIARRS